MCRGWHNIKRCFASNGFVHYGGAVVDGTCTWLLTDVRDCFPVGAVRASLYLPLGYTKALGAEVLRADYPRLVRLADEEELWTNDPTNNPGLFGVGDGVTTFVLPNWSDRMVQLTATGAGAALAAGLPDLTGLLQTTIYNGTANGVFAESTTDTQVSLVGSGGSWYHRNVRFNASSSNAIYGRSTTVQPPAIKMLPIMRY